MTRLVSIKRTVSSTSVVVGNDEPLTCLFLKIAYKTPKTPIENHMEHKRVPNECTDVALFKPQPSLEVKAEAAKYFADAVMNLAYAWSWKAQLADQRLKKVFSTRGPPKEVTYLSPFPREFHHTFELHDNPIRPGMSLAFYSHLLSMRETPCNETATTITTTTTTTTFGFENSHS